ncbi:MAG: hypothetical protein LBD73_08575 [Deferribacteraceae bacterium]|nr:hypothetical protein [Deferribacteraceae bacterium]
MGRIDQKLTQVSIENNVMLSPYVTISSAYSSSPASGYHGLIAGGALSSSIIAFNSNYAPDNSTFSSEADNISSPDADGTPSLQLRGNLTFYTSTLLWSDDIWAWDDNNSVMILRWQTE